MKRTPIMTTIQNLNAALTRAVARVSTWAFPRRLLLGVAVLATVTGEAAGNPGGGGGGGGGGTGGGDIYFWGNSTVNPFGSLGMIKMDSEGGNRTELGFGVEGTPSPVPHNGFHWFVRTIRIDAEEYPDGTPRQEVILVRDDFDELNNNNANTMIQVTDDPAVHPVWVDWGPETAQISFIGRRWSPSVEPGATVSEGGLYAVSLVFGPDGAIVGAAAPPTTPTIPFPLVEGAIWPEASVSLWPDVGSFDWNPSATDVVYSNFDLDELWRANLLGAHTRILSGRGYCTMPTWAPAGDRIMYTGSFGIYTIKPSGGGLRVVIGITADWNFGYARYSPDGSYIAFMGSPTTTGEHQIFRATASGRDLVNLTSAYGRGMFGPFLGGWVGNVGN